MIDPSPIPGDGQRSSRTTSSSAPAIFRSTFFSAGTRLGTIASMRCPSALAIAASEIPVLPDVGSTIPRPSPSRPASRACRIRAQAARSFTEPNGLVHSSFAHSGNPSDTAIALSRTIGEGFSSSGSISKTLS